MSDVVDAALIGAGPCRLSLAAHLRSAGGYWSILQNLVILARAVYSVICGIGPVMS